MTCLIDNTFNIGNLAHKTALDSILSRLEKEKFSSAKDLVNKIKAAISIDSNLKNTGYNPGSDFTTQQLREYNKLYRESIKTLGNYILAHLRLKNTYPNGIKEELENSLKQTSTDKNPWESVPLVLSELSEFDTELNSTSYDKASESFFRESRTTSGYYNELNFKRQFFDNCVIIRSKFPTLVTTNEKLNSRIIYMQKILGDKLKKIVPGFENTELAYKKKDLNRSWDLHTENMYNLMKAAKEEVEKLTSNPNFFLHGYQDVMDGKVNIAYDAVCAYFSLLYFDDLLEQSVGKFVAFDKSLKNRFSPLSLNKYNFAFDTKHHRHNFSQDSDAMTVEQNTSLFTKLIIETIPVSIGTNKVVSKYLTTVSLSDSICKLKSIASQIEGGKFPKSAPDTDIAYLQFCLDNYRNDPISYASIIFKLLNSKDVKDKLMTYTVNGKQLFTSTDFAIYKAVYNYVYSDEEGSLSRALSNEDFNKIESIAIETKYEQLKKTKPNITKDEVEVLDSDIEAVRKKIHISRNISTYDPVSCISIFFNDCVPVDIIDTEIDLEGNIEIKQREKSKVNQGVFFKCDCIDYGNNMRNLAQNEHLIKNNDDTRITSLGNDKTLSSISVNDKNVGISIVYDGNKKSIFNESQNFNVKIVKTGSDTLDLQEKGSSGGTQLSTFVEILNKYLSGKPSETISSLLKWIDDRLFLGISTEEGKLKLKILIENNSDVKEIFRDMIKSALRAQVTLELRDLKPDGVSFDSFLKTYNGFKDSAFKRNTKKGFASTLIKVVKPGTASWLDAWETAELIFKGYDQKSVSKNFFGKNESNYSKSFLGANPRHQAKQYFDQQVEIENQVNNFVFKEGESVNSVKRIFNIHGFNKDVTLNNIQNFFTDKNIKDVTDEEGAILESASKALKEEYYKTNYKETAASVNYFTKNPKALGRTVIKTVAKNQLGKPKFIKEMNTGELIYDSFVHSFCGASRTNSILIQCTTFSDKTKFVHSKIDLSYTLSSGVNLNMATIEQIQDEYLETVGKSLKITLENTRILYKKLLTEYAKERNLDLKFDTVEEINQTLGNFNSGALLKDLNRIATKLGEKFFADTHYVITKSKSGQSILQLNPLLVYQANILYADDKEQFKKRWQLQEELFIKGIIDSGVQFKTPDSLKTDKSDNDESLASLLKKYPVITGIFKLNHNKDKKDVDFYNEYAKEWIKNGQLILGKKADGTDVTYSDKNLSGIKLNPLLEKFFGLDTLLSANLRILYTGTELAHPYKKATGNAVALNFSNIEGYNNLTDDIKSNLQQLANADDLNGLIDYLNTNKSKKLDTIRDQIKEIVHERALNIENALQGIQLKRNVIIPATMSYVNPNLKEGVSQTTKVAIVKDIKANVWEFVKRGNPIDSMDGSALTCPLQSILENNSLKTNAVGHDKKPIWQSYDGFTNSATLVKFASFEMTNQRLRDSIVSDVSLLKLLKRMYGIRWSSKYDWSENPILCGNTGYNNREKVLFKNMTNGKPLIYKDADGNYKQIQDLTFEWIDESDHSKGFVYKTTESYINELTGSILGKSEVYHLFDNDGNHIKLTKDEFEANKNTLLNTYHTIDSLFDLWNVLGGCYTYDFKEGGFVGNELSHQVLANYVNNIAIPTFSSLDALGKTRSIQEANESQLVYKQPLKEMFIGYIANTSAVKNGQGNVNESSAWDGNEELNYIELDNTNLGIQMDADHEMANSEMTEFSQVITALEANGRTHHLSKEIYYTLGRIATNASKIELESLDLFKQHPELSKNQIYDVLSKSIIEHSRLNGNRVSLAEVLIQRLEREFGIHLTDHDSDTFKLPFSDSSIYSQILPTFASSINNKSIKRKFPGSGCVMCPGYNIMQVFKFKEGDVDLTLTADDILDRVNKNKKLKSKDVKEKIYEQYKAVDETSKRRALINWYLNEKQIAQEPYTLDEFGPTDIIDIRDQDDNYLDSLSLDDIDVYYDFIENRDEYIKNYLQKKGRRTDGIVFKYRHSAIKPRNLAPAIITWNYSHEVNGVLKNKKYNLFELNAFKECFKLDKAISEAKSKDEKELFKKQYSLVRLAAQRQLNVIAKGQFYIDGSWNEDRTSWIDGNLVKCENLKNEPAELIVSNMYAEKFGIKNKSVGSILKRGPRDFRIAPKLNLPQTKFDLCFRKTNGEDVLVTFDKVDKSNGTYQPWEHKDLVSIDNKNGTIEVYLKDKNGNPKFQVGRLMPSDKYEYHEDETGNKYFIDKITRKKVDNKNLRNLKSGIYEYKEFISKYSTTKVDSVDGFGEIVRDVTVYKINKKSIEDSMVFIGETSDSVKRFNINSAIAKRIKDLYKSENFLGIEISNELNYLSASSLIPILEHMDYDDNWKSIVGDKIVEILKKKINDINNSLKDDKKKVRSEIKINLDNEIDQINKYYTDYYDKNALERFNSWKASLYFTAARIPAQSHQSFMQMKTVAYSGSDKNICYVSHWQTFLQGSDYK